MIGKACCPIAVHVEKFSMSCIPPPMLDAPAEQRAVKAQVKLADSAKTLEHSAIR